MGTYEITTKAMTRSESRAARTWIIEASDVDEACVQAREIHEKVVGWKGAIACSPKGYVRDLLTGGWVQK